MRKFDNFSVASLLHAADVAIKAAKLFETQGWCQGFYAKVGDIPADIANPEKLPEQGVCYCSMGALYKVVGGFRVGDAETILDLAYETIYGTWIVKYNDAPGRTKEQAVAALKRAAALLIFEASQRDALERCDNIIQALNKGWCRHALSRNARELLCVPWAKDAVCWCLSGAKQRADHTRPENSLYESHWAQNYRDYQSVPYFNDNVCSTKEEAIASVQQLRDRIAALKWDDPK